MTNLLEPESIPEYPTAALFADQHLQTIHNLGMVDRYLTSLFLQIGIPANQRGFEFLHKAVQIAVEEPSLQRQLMHGLYPRVADHFHTSVNCVEHNIRCAITAAWNRGRPELVEKLLGRRVITAYAKPTNGELIALVAENVRLLLSKMDR